MVMSDSIKDPDRLFNNLAVEIGSKYEEVGIYLGLTYKMMKEKLETDAFLKLTASMEASSSEKALMMLQLWKDSVAEEDLTYSKLAAALEKNHFNHCAHKYCYTTAIESSSGTCN